MGHRHCRDGKRQLARLRLMFLKLVSGKRLVCLDVRVDFSFMQDELVALLRARIGRLG
jgi:predicted protein tyrosine phosphatase